PRAVLGKRAALAATNSMSIQSLCAWWAVDAKRLHPRPTSSARAERRLSDWATHGLDHLRGGGAAKSPSESRFFSHAPDRPLPAPTALGADRVRDSGADRGFPFGRKPFGPGPDRQSAAERHRLPEGHPAGHAAADHPCPADRGVRGRPGGAE